jgi:FlaA1/EpsC-like NDP-sugar epimerase
MIPPVDDLLHGDFRLHLRDVDINDLLRRPPIQLDSVAIGEMLRGRRVLVTGAGGSIGSEICRQLLRHDPHSLILVERSENSLFHIDQNLPHWLQPTKSTPAWPIFVTMNGCDPVSPASAATGVSLQAPSTCR